MADITAADVVVTQTHDDEDYSGQRMNRMYPIIAFGNGILTYPATGVPLPDKIKFRLKSFVKRLFIERPPAAYDYVFDATNWSIRIYVRATGAELSGAVPATTLPLMVEGA